ncbi:MAG: hypothetical protein IJU60_02990 [Acholeplasmatales bacterium]|nr:hypothetical protein [Acholeplasmatales bacterium]
MIYTRSFNIDNTGNKDVTKDIQKVLDEYQGEDIYLDKGKYLVSNLYLKSNTNLYLDPEAFLIGTTEEDKYDIIKTRVAGIDMDWYPAILNIIDSENVMVSGGHIIGAGEYFYLKYWGKDMHSGMRGEYDKLGLRSFCDYDCKRVRNMLVSNSNNIVIKDIELKDSGFWNLHILYSNDILVDHIKIISDNPIAPSTDGIDVDSSYDVTIKNSIISTNDDSISIKSGRDYDGFSKNISSHDIKIDNCEIFNGYGISFGSELSAGIYNVFISNIHYKNTDAGIRIKSSKTRKGYIKNIHINNIVATDVKYLFHFMLNWNPNYSISVLPKDIKDIKPHYLSLTKEIEDMPNTKVSDIYVDEVQSEVVNSKISRIFTMIGFDDNHMDDITFKHMNIWMKEYGIIKNVDNMNVSKSLLYYDEEYNSCNDDFDNR